MSPGAPRRSYRRPLQLTVLAALIALGGLVLTHDGVRARARRLVRGPDSALVGHWGTLRDDTPHVGLTPAQRAEIVRLQSLGYTGAARISTDRSGLTALDPDLASRGLRLIVSGHAPRAVLATREGETVHAWSYAYQDVYDALPGAFLPPASSTGCWRRVRLLPDGGLLAVYEGHGLIRLDRDSNLVWSYAGRCHHDLDLAPDGGIWVLTREAGLVPRLHPNKPILVDSVTRLDSQGHALRSIPLLEAFEASPYAYMLPRPPVSGDVFHTNTLERLDGRLADRLPAFRDGNLLISVRELDMIAVLDPEREEIVWAARGPWARQHEPTVLDNGHLLLFDNRGAGEGRSRVLEIDPVTLEVVWDYAGPPASPLDSETCGVARRLANGNTLVVESDGGRALETTPDGLVVWEYYNPYRAGKRRELIAAILDIEVLPEGFVPAWLQAPTPELHSGLTR